MKIVEKRGTMNKIKRFKNILILALVGLVFTVCLPMLAKAEESEDRVTHKYGRTTSRVNVREGPGDGEYAILKVNDTDVTLDTGTEVIITEEKPYEAGGGRIWYHVIFQYNNEETSGWVTSSYVTVTGSVTATPTPTPTPTNTPTPAPTDTPSPEPSPTPALPDSNNQLKKSKDVFWKTVIAILVIMVVVIVAIYIYNKITYSKSRNNEIDRKMKYLKNVDLGDKDDGSTPGVKRPTVRVVGESVGEPEEDTVDSQREIRARIDRLKQHDIVTHKYFGKGEVFDNSDVKLMEVRFGLDVRYLNKDSLAAKHLLTFDDDEKRPTKRKL